MTTKQAIFEAIEKLPEQHLEEVVAVSSTDGFQKSPRPESIYFE